MLFTSDDIILSEVDNRCLIIIHNKKNPSDDDIGRIGSFYRAAKANISEYQTIVMTDGGGPTSRQRKQQQEEFGSDFKNMRTAVVSDAITVRFVVSSFMLFTKKIKAVEPGQFGDALDFLDLSAAARDEITLRMDAIASEVPKGRFKTFDAVMAR